VYNPTDVQGQEGRVASPQPRPRISEALQTKTGAGASTASILIRFAAGGIFLSEGMQKFLFPIALGVGRFQKIGIPLPGFFAPFVGTVETVCGLLLILGLLTRWAAMPLILDMLVALYTTKLPILLKSGFWSMAHESRTDYAMLLSLLFLLIAGPGAISLDAARGAWRGRQKRTAADAPAAPQT
jgi:putative oxidoreductase